MTSTNNIENARKAYIASKYFTKEGQESIRNLGQICNKIPGPMLACMIATVAAGIFGYYAITTIEQGCFKTKAPASCLNPFSLVMGVTCLAFSILCLTAACGSGIFWGVNKVKDVKHREEAKKLLSQQKV